MGKAWDGYYFRIRENGAMVFIVHPETREKRIELEPIATLNIKSGAIRPNGIRAITREDELAIGAWMAERRLAIKARALSDAAHLRDQLNVVTQWAQNKASEVEINEVADDLLMALHDLRQVLVRRKSERGSTP